MSKQRNRPKNKAPTPKGPSAATPPPEEKSGDRVIEAQFLAGATEVDQFPPPVMSEIAFAGRSNVGKSSLLNSLMQRNGLVRTSSTPGCTRQISWFEAIADDKANLHLVDLPGYGYAKRSKSERKQWAHLIESYLLARSTLKGVVILIDIRRGLEEEEKSLLELLEGDSEVSRAPLETVIVATKLDKLSNSARKPALAALCAQVGRPVLGYAAPEHLGRRPLWRKIRRIAGVSLLEAAPDQDS
ncbi:MAG: ribosome biogenesis GTP-binding protein YihA/YsxC [Polyangiaceae bacterium]|nr:ribosome biogenesis GTP-binding protein YihA/YsxC [Polyangiaceae bacterium]